jgi:hypothetical protein
LADRISQYAAPGVARAVDDGFLEERIRNRLSSFYSTYSPPDA